MNNEIITELVGFEILPTTKEMQLLEKAEIINKFLCKQDGFIDAKLIKPLGGNTWYFIYHIENFKKLQVVGEKLRRNNLFEEIATLIVPKSLNMSFFHQVKNW